MTHARHDQDKTYITGLLSLSVHPIFNLLKL